nr:MAG TPA: hypothetical protein [Caudoviricetes sp.]
MILQNGRFSKERTKPSLTRILSRRYRKSATADADGL